MQIQVFEGCSVICITFSDNNTCQNLYSVPHLVSSTRHAEDTFAHKDIFFQYFCNLKGFLFFYSFKWQYIGLYNARQFSHANFPMHVINIIV